MRRSSAGLSARNAEGIAFAISKRLGAVIHLAYTRKLSHVKRLVGPQYPKALIWDDMNPNELNPGEVINVGKSAVLAHSMLCQGCEIVTRGYLFLHDRDIWWFVCSVCEVAQEC